MNSLAAKIIVCVLAGLGAGVGTGFAGMSAAVVISPMLIAFLNMDAYSAVGIALASDVLASAVSAFTYARNKNIDIKNGLVMMFTVLLFTFVGSWTGKFMPSSTLGNLSFLTSFFIGLKFLIWPVKKTKEEMKEKSTKRKIIESILCGIYIGFVCGFMGAGGGLMMLFVLTTFMGYELKTAVGTSVFIMTFSALFGAGSHFVIGGTPDWLCLVLCAGSTLLFAELAARIANKVEVKVLNRITGIFLTVLGVIMLAFRIWQGNIAF